MTPQTGPELRLDEIEARANAATPGPWTVSEDYSDVVGPEGDQLASYWNPTSETRNGEFIAHARTDVPALVAEIRRLRAELAQYEVLNPQQCPAGEHADWLVDSEYAHACPWCVIEKLRSAAETHVVADDSDDPEHIDDCPGCNTATPRTV